MTIAAPAVNVIMGMAICRSRISSNSGFVALTEAFFVP